jgi:hypothetical protein
MPSATQRPSPYHRAFRSRRASTLALACVLFVACAPTGPRVLAHNELVSVVLDQSASGATLELRPAQGVHINAQLKPVIEQRDAAPLVFDSPLLTTDSAYFAGSAVAAIGARQSVHGTLRASACPEGKRVCLSVALDVNVR